MSLALPIGSALLARFCPPTDAATILVHGKDQPVGDAFIQSGFFHALRCRFPAAKITFAVSLGGTPYADGLCPVMAPFIDEILCDQRISLDRANLRPTAPRPLPNLYFDLIIDFEKVWWQTLIVRRIRHRVFVSASKHFLYSDRWPRSWSKPPRLADQYGMLLDAVGMPPRANLPPLDFRNAQAEHLARELVPPGPRYVGLVPGAGNREKCWPLKYYLDVARQVQADGAVPVMLLGPGEADWVATVRQASPAVLLPAWCGSQLRPEFRNPLQTVAIGRQLAAAVTNDCGTAHMLAAAGVPLVALFGSTNPVKYAPLTSRLSVLAAPSFGGTNPSAIPVGAVSTALELLLRDSQRQPATS